LFTFLAFSEISPYFAFFLIQDKILFAAAGLKTQIALAPPLKKRTADNAHFSGNIKTLCAR
jgi:hypothetical protein